MRVITVINQKGGVGKTTTTYGLGEALRADGKRVLFVDLDPQSNLSFTIGADGARVTTASLLMGDNIAIVEAIAKAELGDIVPSSLENSSAEKRVTGPGSEYRLRDALREKPLPYDYVLIDTPPALGILTVNALTASDGVLVPVLADGYSLQGLAQLQDTLGVVKKYCNPNLKVYGLVLSRFNPRAAFNREAKGQLEKQAEALGTKLFSSIIRECISVKESLAMGLNLFTYATKATAAEDFRALAKEFQLEVV